MAYKVFSNGDALTGSELNTYLMNQSVMVFASTTARDAALTAPTEGMVVWLQDANKYVYYTGSAWADLITPAPSGNAIINGAFDIWQRGTSFVNPGVQPYTADRWRSYRGGYATGSTFQRVSTGTLSPQLQYAMRMQRNSGDTSTMAVTIDGAIETANSLIFAGQTVTFSYYARRGADYSAASSAFTFNVFYGTGTDQAQSSFTGRTLVVSSNATLTTSWQRFTATATVPANATQIGYEGGFTPVGTAGANDYAEVTGVQLEAGSVATPFKRNAPSIQAEQSALERYLAAFGGDSIYQAIGTGTGVSSTNALIFVPFNTKLRSVPTSVEYSTLALAPASGSVLPLTALTIEWSGTKGIWMRATVSSGISTAAPYFLVANNSTSAYLRLPAEL